MTVRAMPGAAPRTLTTALFILLLAYGLFSTAGLVRYWGLSLPGGLMLAAFVALAAWMLVPRATARGRTGWTMVAILALGLRGASAAIAAGRVSTGDSQAYIVLARGLLAGHGLVFFEPYMGVSCRALYPPFYAMVLAGWGAVAGFGTPSLLLLSTLIDTAAAAMLVLIGRRLGQPRAGLTAAALYLIWPSVLLSAPLAQKEGLCVLFVLALVHAWLRAIDPATPRRPWRQAPALGVPAALLALTQPGEALLAALLGLALIPRAGWRRILAIGAPAAAVALAVMLPWWIRNWIALGAFVPLTTSAGIGLWIGNNPDATGNWMPYPAQLHGLPEIAFAKAAGAIARGWIVDHPLAFARLSAAKFLHAMAIGGGGVARLAAMTPPPSAAVAAALFTVAHGAHLFLLAAAGAGLWLRRSPALAILAWLLIACFAQLLLFGIWFEFAERHRDFMIPLLLLAVAVASQSAPRASRDGAGMAGGMIPATQRPKV